MWDCRFIDSRMLGIRGGAEDLIGGGITSSIFLVQDLLRDTVSYSRSRIIILSNSDSNKLWTTEGWRSGSKEDLFLSIWKDCCHRRKQTNWIWENVLWGHERKKMADCFFFWLWNLFDWPNSTLSCNYMGGLTIWRKICCASVFVFIQHKTHISVWLTRGKCRRRVPSRCDVHLLVCSPAFISFVIIVCSCLLWLMMILPSRNGLSTRKTATIHSGTVKTFRTTGGKKQMKQHKPSFHTDWLPGFKTIYLGYISMEVKGTDRH